MVNKIFTENSRMGVKQQDGKIIIPAQYSEIEEIGAFNGSALLRITDEIKKGRKTLQFHGLVTETGQEILEID